MAELTEAQRIRIARGKTWIDENAVKPLDEITAQMGERCDKFIEEVDGLSEAQLSFVEGEGKWTIRQVCLHVALVIPGVANLIPVLAGGTQPSGGKAKPGMMADDPGSHEALVAQLRAGFDAAVGVVDRLKDSPNIETKAEHPFFGYLQCLEWYAFNLLHLTVHVAQVQRIKANAAFPK